MEAILISLAPIIVPVLAAVFGYWQFKKKLDHTISQQNSTSAEAAYKMFLDDSKGRLKKIEQDLEESARNCEKEMLELREESRANLSNLRDDYEARIWEIKSSFELERTRHYQEMNALKLDRDHCMEQLEIIAVAGHTKDLKIEKLSGQVALLQSRSVVIE